MGRVQARGVRQRVRALRVRLHLPATTTHRQGEWRLQLERALCGGNPERRLWAAVLRDAIEALNGSHPDARSGQARWHSKVVLWREACAWVMSRQMEPIGTFESICDALGLDVDVVRRDLCTLGTRLSAVEMQRESA